MHYKRRNTFSNCNSYFSYISPDNNFIVWETSSTNVLVDYNLDSRIYGACTSIHWIPSQKLHHSPKKAKLSKTQHDKTQLLALGTSKGDIVLFNIIAGNLYSHLASRHSDSINDISYCQQADSLITCSSDKFIAVWDISSGQLKSKWQVDDGPIVSVCSIDENNLLAAGSTSILWWNVIEKSIIKKFCGNSKDIFKLLPVNVDKSLKSCYFLAAYENDSRIDAWSLSFNKAPVASFVTSDQPHDMDISSISSKEKPLIMAVITQKGYLNLFEHTLNGNVNQSLYPKTSIEILPEPTSKNPDIGSIMSVKVSDDSESCIIAYGSSKDTVVFKHIKIKKAPESMSEPSLSNSACSEKVFSKKKVEKRLSVNGLQTPEKSSKAVKLKDSTSSSQKEKVVSTPDESSSQTTSVPLHKKLPDTDLSTVESSNRMNIKHSDIQDPENLASVLLKGLKTQDDSLIDNVLHTTDHKLLCNCVQNIPSYTLKYVLEELSSRLKQHRKSSPLLGKWLKEIFRIHFKYLIQSEETRDVLYSIKESMEAKRIQETVTKLTALRGLLSLQTQIGSNDESDSENETSTD